MENNKKWLLEKLNKFNNFKLLYGLREYFGGELEDFCIDDIRKEVLVNLEVNELKGLLIFMNNKFMI